MCKEDNTPLTLPVASTGGLLFYTEDGHSSEDVLVVNPLTGEQKILGVPTLDNGAPASLEEAQADGDDHENGDDLSEADAEDESVVISYESELDEISDSGRSEWDEDESADEEGIMLLKPFKIPNQGTECDSKLAEYAGTFVHTGVCFLFVLSFFVWFFLWPPEEVLTLLFFLHHENGDFFILMKILSLEYFFSAESLASQAEYMFSIIVYGVSGSKM